MKSVVTTHTQHTPARPRTIFVLVVPEMPRLKFLAVLAAIRQGTHLERDDINYRQIPWIEIMVPQLMQLNMDGEPHDIRDARLSVRQRRLPMYLLPRPLWQHTLHRQRCSQLSPCHSRVRHDHEHPYNA